MGSNNSKTTAKSLDVGSKTGVIILSKKNFKSFPKPLLKQQNDQYTKVRSLDLSSNLIVHLNNINLSHFKSLKSLNLSKNKLLILQMFFYTQIKMGFRLVKCYK